MSSPQAPTPDVEELRALCNKLYEWRAGTHEVWDGENGPTGELVDEPKDFNTLQQERQDAAHAIGSLLDETDALRERLDAVREGWGHLTASMNKGNEGAPAWFTVSVEDVAAFDSVLAPTSDKTKGDENPPAYDSYEEEMEATARADEAALNDPSWETKGGADA